MSDSTIHLNYNIPANDFTFAGEASSNVKKMLIQLGIEPGIIKKTAIAMYEAEINAVIHGGGGIANIEISPERIIITIKDDGPGIPDVDMAMQEGYSTAPDYVREMGFGAGMGLPNIKRYADKLRIDTEIGKGTTVYITINIS